MKTITSKTAKNGVQLWYVDGKRIAKSEIFTVATENHREIICKALAERNIAAASQTVKHDINLHFIAQITLVDNEFAAGWNEFSFAGKAEAVSAVQAVKNALGDKFHEAVIFYKGGFYAPQDVLTKITADSDETDTAEVKSVDFSDEADEPQDYIFSKTLVSSGYSAHNNAHYSKLERIDKECKILGNSEQPNGSIYREVAFYNTDHAHSWAVKTSDGKVIISGHDEPDFDKIFEAVKAYENAEVTETVTKKFTTVKAENAAHAVEILGELNFRNVEFVYHGETNEHGAPVVYRHFDGIKDGHDTCFGLIEIVINGKLDTVRFINNYREQFTDIKIGDAKYTLGDKGEINLIDEPATETVNSETNNDADVGFTREDFLKEVTVTLNINAAAEKILATADNFRYLDQRHEISLTKPDSEIMWERDFRGYKGDETFLVTEVYNHPDGTLREVFLRGDGLPVTVKIAEPNRNMKLAADTVKAEFDKAVTESVKDYGATFEINGETLTFEDGQVTQVASLRYEAYFTIRNGRKNFYYRGNRVSKKDFFEHITTQDKALAQRDQIAQFVTKYGGSEILPGLNPQGNFVAQIHPTLANGRQDNYFATFDSKDDAHAFIAEFKKLACGMKFMATIKRGSFHGEVIYRHGLKGQEFFATDEPEITDETDEGVHTMTEKIEVAIGADAVPAMIDIFEPNKITLNTGAQILKLIEDAAGSSFSFDYESYFINTDDDTRHKFITRHFVSECKNYSFIEIFTADGKLDHVEFLKHFLAGYKEVKFYLAAPAQDNESQDDDTDKYFELADELDEIGGDICDTKDILERKIANGAPQTEIKSLEDYIDEREGEYRALHKRIYGVEPQADNKVYPIDIAIYHGGSALTEAELEDTAAQFRTAITANGNFGKVEVQESYLSVIGDIGGDNKTIWKLIGDLCRRGDCVLESWDAETEELREMPGVEIDALLERMGIDNEPLAFEIPAYDAAVKKIFGSDAGAIFTPGGHLTVEVAV